MTNQLIYASLTSHLTVGKNDNTSTSKVIFLKEKGKRKKVKSQKRTNKQKNKTNRNVFI